MIYRMFVQRLWQSVPARFCALCVLFFAICTNPAGAQQKPAPKEKFSRATALDDLSRIAGIIRANYFDPTYGGVDFDALVKEATERVRGATTRNDAYAAINAMVEGLKDNRLWLSPPVQWFRVRHGWTARCYGERCFITNVRAGSDAEAKRIKRGDELLGWEQFRVTRQDLPHLRHALLGILPRSASTLLVASPGAAPREVLVKAKVSPFPSESLPVMVYRITDGMEWYKPEVVEHGESLVIRLESLYTSEADLKKALQPKDSHKTLILDLRGSCGWRPDRLRQLVAATFDHEVKIADVGGRKPEKPWMAAPNEPFTGRLMVLTDSETTGDAELYARLVQLEKRGKVIGDRTAGAVGRVAVLPHDYSYQISRVDRVGGHRREVEKIQEQSVVMVPTAALVPSDGKRLDKVGVQPDQVILPNQEDLAAGRDPVLANALARTGAEITPEQAGNLFARESDHRHAPVK